MKCNEISSAACYPEDVWGERGGSSVLEAGCEADAEGGAEELLDPGIEGAEDPIELVVVDLVVLDLPDEEDGVLLPDGEGGAVELEVPTQQVLEELLVVLLGG